ncbi:MAG: hypothetical protein KatS3mg060_2708 [Dehalococcoidia bacterium]|nr:MAG: hypothetical protein KatS3mg060_2708 [Dehalococcoidia bacterium]
MRFEGCRTLLAPPEVVWSTLLDPGVLRTCIPGCQEVRLDGAEYHVRATLAMLFVRGTYQGRVRLVNPVRPHAFPTGRRYRYRGREHVSYRLTGDSTTTLHYFCEAYLEGTLPSLR